VDESDGRLLALTAAVFQGFEVARPGQELQSVCDCINAKGNRSRYLVETLIGTRGTVFGSVVLTVAQVGGDTLDGVNGGASFRVLIEQRDKN